MELERALELCKTSLKMLKGVNREAWQTVIDALEKRLKAEDTSRLPTRLTPILNNFPCPSCRKKQVYKFYDGDKKRWCYECMACGKKVYAVDVEDAYRLFKAFCEFHPN